MSRAAGGAAAGAAILALAVLRPAARPSLASVSADSAAPAPPPPPPRPKGDLARAFEIMEKYQRMSREALQANAVSAGGSGDARDGEEIDEGEGEGEAVSESGDGVVESGDGVVGGSEGGNEEGLNIIEVDVLPPLATTETEAPEATAAPETPRAPETPVAPEAPAAPEAPKVPAEPAEPAVPAKKKKRPRIPAAKLFGDMDVNAAGDFCVPYLVVGGGTAAWSAIQAIRKRDSDAVILLITDEDAYPYNRTPLSKELWSPGAAGLFTSEIFTRDAVEYSYAGAGAGQVSIIRGTTAVALDVDAKSIALAGGPTVQYDKLLLATGGAPREAASVCGALAAPEVAGNVSVFRTVGDFRALREDLGADGSRVAVVGGGFLGTELAVAMASEGRRVTLLCAEPGVLYKVLPRYLSQFLSKRLRALGVDVVESAVVTDAVAVDGGKVKLEIGMGLDGVDVEAVDRVVIATGIVPRVELAAHAGLEIDRKNGGIVVNDQMNAEAAVWVAGDVASFWDRILGRLRVEHWDHAVVSGRIAGDRMAGGDSRYGLQSMFWSDLENVGVSFEAVGRVENGSETVSSWNLSAPAFEYAPSSSSYTEGVVWYLRDKVIVGAVLWNLRGRKPLAEARKAISTRRKVESDDDAASIITLPEAPYSVVVRTEADAVLDLE